MHHFFSTFINYAIVGISLFSLIFIQMTFSLNAKKVLNIIPTNWHNTVSQHM